MSNILIKDGLLVESSRSWHADLLIEGESISRIDSIIPDSELPADTEVINAEHLCVLPGLIDAHTHYHLVSRGTVTADSFVQGSKAAAFGGVTTVIDFADHDKNRPLAESARERIGAMQNQMAIDFSLHQGVYGVPATLEKELASVKALGISAIKIFTTYKNVGYLIESEKLERLFKACKALNLLVTAHCEDDEYLESVAHSRSWTYSAVDHADLRPAEAEYRAIRKLGSLALKVGIPLYIVHISSALGMQAVRQLRAEGATIIAETTPHYLLLDRRRLEGDSGALYVMTPPLRTRKDSIALQDALVAREIQVVATDHCSFTAEQKLSSQDCRTIYPGIPGTEEMLPLIFTFAVASGRMSLSQMVRLLSTGPARAFGLYPRKGSLQVGTDADIVLFDPEVVWTIDSHTIHSASGYSPYEGSRVMGKAEMTFLRGRLVMGDGVYLGRPGDGRFVTMNSSNAYGV
ncbi:MAG: amidohydrolase family protein [Sphaerochaetaceae bacterium]|nr:amidohydrolase family protein [Spirochaetales bacterium]